jgi:hypothetical protein
VLNSIVRSDFELPRGGLDAVVDIATRKLMRNRREKEGRVELREMDLGFNM